MKSKALEKIDHRDLEQVSHLVEVDSSRGRGVEEGDEFLGQQPQRRLVSGFLQRRTGSH